MKENRTGKHAKPAGKLPAAEKPREREEVRMEEAPGEEMPMEFIPGELRELTVSALTEIGAFLETGAKKELLLPFKEQTRELKEGEKVLVALYVDKTGRPCSTMRIEPWLSLEPTCRKGDLVWGTVYEVSYLGLFTAVENKYSGLIPRAEAEGITSLGRIEARVLRVRPDGKVDLSLRESLKNRMSTEGAELAAILKKAGGFLPVNDDSDPEEIQELTGMSKKAFKRAVGHLLKAGRIEIVKKGIREKRSPSFRR